MKKKIARARPCPSASDFLIRPARDSDAPALARLLAELGYATSPTAVTKRLKLLSNHTCNCILVAVVKNDVVGLAALHVVPLIHLDGSMARMTALVVSEKWQGKGIGEKLVRAVEKVAQKKNCTRVEVTSGDQRIGAHTFYNKLGYEAVSRRFVKIL